MKSNTPLESLAIILTLTLAGSVAFAGNRAQAPQKQPQARQKVQKILQKFDRNSDGVLDAAELEAMVMFKHQKRHKMKKHMKKRFDTNGNGQLEPAERQAMQAAKQQRKAQILQQFDRNGNGQLEPGEKQAAKQSMMTTRVNKRFDRMLSRHDANQDGALSWNEVQQAAQNKGSQKGSQKGLKMRQRFQSADRNSDGLVTRAEFTQAARDRFQNRHQHGF